MLNAESLLLINLLINDLAYSGILKVILLSIVQGITEWFPVSSTGHLVFLRELLNIRVSAAFDILLHAGSLTGVVLVTRKDLHALLKALLKLDFSSSEGKMLVYLILGTTPIVTISLLLKEFIDAMFTNLFSTGVAMLISGAILYLTKNYKPRSRLNASNALLIGVSQALAIIPGVSRMGITVSTALISGLEYDEAYRFSLLLSVLSITGGCIFKLSDFCFENDLIFILLGIAITAAVSVFTLKLLKRQMIKQNFYKFAYYCLLVGGVILILSVF
ncbi:MAG: undecaprenyl-diphosphate phosphatase [Candidatus Brockarchaeota archaeon]|nr:undecaprenyl-diphosphate phosphatase [Candidatus Brockarchaeota archaeon]